MKKYEVRNNLISFIQNWKRFSNLLKLFELRENLILFINILEIKNKNK